MDTAQSINELQETLLKLQKEIEELKTRDMESKSKPIKSSHFPAEFKDELDEAQNKVTLIFKKMLDKGYAAASTCISAASIASDKNGRGINTSIGTSTMQSLDEINDEGLSSALEVFSNPRRITILKLLAGGGLTAGEITQKTGFIGGQLYHHLSILENAGLIGKETDKYQLLGNSQGGSAQSILTGLTAVVGGMKIAKNK